MHSLAPSHIMDLDTYVPGKTIRETREKYGISDLVKLASNENAWGPSKKAVEAAKMSLIHGHLYPVERRAEVKQAICDFHAAYPFEQRHIVLGNGSSELIVLLVRALLCEDEILLNAWPSFLMYRLAAKAHARQEATVMLTPDLKYDLGTMVDLANGTKRDQIKLVFIANPNNPTGRYINEPEMSDFLHALPAHVVVVVDEAYSEYVSVKDFAQSLPWVLKRPRTVVLRTFSKIYGLAGYRMGYAICDPEIAAILHRIRDPFNVNAIAQDAAIAALSDIEHVAMAHTFNKQELERMREALNAFGLATTESAANFVLMHLQEGMPHCSTVIERLLSRGVIVRGVQNYDLPRSIRVTIGKPQENERFLAALSDVLKL